MRSRLAPILAVLLLVASACGAAVTPTPTPAQQPSASLAAAAFPATVTDFQNRSVTVPKRPERIVSIGPSITEFLFALGAGTRVVGADDFSDEPAAAKLVEKVGGIKVNFEKVVSLRPDLVLSVKFSDGTIEKLAGAGLLVLVVDPQSASDVARTAILLGRAVGSDGDAMARDIQKRVDDVRTKTSTAATKPRVYHEIDASDPTKIFTVGPGSYIHDLIEIAGGQNIAARAASAYPQLSAEEILRSDPEIIVLAAADYSAKPDQVAARTGWAVIAAVRNKRIETIAPNLINRPGPRVGEAAEAYAKIVHPELFR
ncbi:MAG TPA: helical backbone metal receptor [Candidatus Limnocylindria bacterium]|jgi:iron complex transport system substrate-binding protein|nr:helical backbone metal receptor [Candidatus Limnocylindria bacterium]